MSEQDSPAAQRFAHRSKILAATLLVAWLAFAFWNSVKPLPPGTHVTSLPARVAESQVDFIDDSAQPRAILERELAAIDRAEQMIVLDHSPVAHDLAQHLLARKRQRPNLEIVLVTDPSNDVGGTPAQYLAVLEQWGIIVARARLERLRDSNPLYSSLWRAAVGWWSDPFDEVPGQATLRGPLRRLNFKADERQLLVADDGAGGWTSVLTSGMVRDGGPAMGSVGLQLRGRLARDIVGSELHIAGWSTDDDRLPRGLPTQGRGVGSIDARFLTEGAVRAGLVEAISVAGSGDAINVATRAVGDRPMVDALLHAAARGAEIRMLLDPEVAANHAVTGEFRRAGAAHIEVRWQAVAGAHGELTLIQHRNDVWLNLGSADFTLHSLGDANLEANIELRMPARAAPARAAAEHFARRWSNAPPERAPENESTAAYWRYRIADAIGLASL
jgi:hypothetical protein